MGLDLILYKRVKDIEDMSMEEEQENELAYGRKTWTIAHFFTNRCQSVCEDYEYIVTRDDWDDFIKSLDGLNDPEFREEVELFIENEHRVNYEEGYYTLFKKLEQWYEEAFGDCYFQLGFAWELRAVLNWFDADDKVVQAFDDGIEVRLIQSY